MFFIGIEAFLASLAVVREFISFSGSGGVLALEVDEAIALAQSTKTVTGRRNIAVLESPCDFTDVDLFET